MDINRRSNQGQRIFPRSTLSQQHGALTHTKNRLDRFAPSSYLHNLIIRLIQRLLTQFFGRPIAPEPRPPKDDPVIRPVYGAPIVKPPEDDLVVRPLYGAPIVNPPKDEPIARPVYGAPVVNPYADRDD